MKLYELLFSPTGGTRTVCEVLSNEYQGEHIEIDLMSYGDANDRADISSDDICLIAVPSFGGRVPVPAAERLRKINGNHAKAILVVVFGNRAYEDTLLELKDIAEESGFFCIAAIAANAEHSIMHQFGRGRPDEEDKAELKQYAADIFQRLSEGGNFLAVSVPGNRPYREHSSLPIHPKAGNACNGCGICASVCPVGAIPRESPAETDNDRCITCMGCVAACPNNARKLNPVLLAAASAKMKKVCSSRKENECMMEISGRISREVQVK